MPNIINKIGQYRSRGWFQRNQADIKVITVHHSTNSQDLNENDDQILTRIQKTHQSRGWPGLSYHFVITPVGTIYQINDFTDITWHDSTNTDSIGVVVCGYMHPPYNEQPTQSQLESLKELLDWLCTQNPQFPADRDDVLGHRDRQATACPGDNLYPYVKEYREKLGNVDWQGVSDSDQVHELKKLLEQCKESNKVLKVQNENLQTELNHLNMANKTLSDKVLVLETELEKLRQQGVGKPLKSYTIMELLQEVVSRLPA